MCGAGSRCDEDHPQMHVPTCLVNTFMFQRCVAKPQLKGSQSLLHHERCLSNCFQSRSQFLDWNIKCYRVWWEWHLDIWKVKVLISCVQLFATPWTVACQTPLSMEFSRQEYWSGLPFPSSGDFPHPGIEPGSPVLQADSLPSEPPGRPQCEIMYWKCVTSAGHVKSSVGDYNCFYC